MTRIERHLEALATEMLEEMVGYETRPSNPNILHISRADGGLNLPAIYTLYKKLLDSKQCQLLTSNNSTVRDLAEKNLESDKAFIIREIFKPVVEILQTIVEDPSHNRIA